MPLTTQQQIEGMAAVMAPLLLRFSVGGCIFGFVVGFLISRFV